MYVAVGSATLIWQIIFIYTIFGNMPTHCFKILSLVTKFVNVRGVREVFHGWRISAVVPVS